MVDGAVESLLENLKHLLIHHVHLINHPPNLLEKLDSVLRLVKAFLRDSTKKRGKEEALLAIESMDYQFFDERQVFVEIAKPREKDFGRYPTTLGPPQEQHKVTKDDIDE